MITDGAFHKTIGSIYLDGVADYLQNQSVFYGTAPFNVNIASNFTFSIWVKPTDLSKGFQTIFSKYDYSTAQNQLGYYLETDANGRLYFRMIENQASGGDYAEAQTSDGALQDNEWTHIVVTHDGDTIDLFGSATHPRIYINGEQDSTLHWNRLNQVVGPTQATNAVFYVGRREVGAGSFGFYFEGYVSHLINIVNYDAGLGGARQLYNGGTPPDPTKLDQTYTQLLFGSNMARWIAFGQTSDVQPLVPIFGSNYQRSAHAYVDNHSVFSTVGAFYSLQEIGLVDASRSIDTPGRGDIG